MCTCVQATPHAQGQFGKKGGKGQLQAEGERGAREPRAAALLASRRPLWVFANGHVVGCACVREMYRGGRRGFGSSCRLAPELRHQGVVPRGAVGADPRCLGAPARGVCGVGGWPPTDRPGALARPRGPPRPSPSPPRTRLHPPHHRRVALRGRRRRRAGESGRGVEGVRDMSVTCP